MEEPWPELLLLAVGDSGACTHKIFIILEKQVFKRIAPIYWRTEVYFHYIRKKQVLKRMPRFIGGFKYIFIILEK